MEDVCRQISVKAYLLLLEVIGKLPFASKASGICSIYKCCGGYHNKLGRCLAHTLHLSIYLTISHHIFGHE